MKNVRAKMRIFNVIDNFDMQGALTSQKITLHPVAKTGGYPIDGSDEDNNYARWTPSGEFTLLISNPALFNQFKINDKYYIDFTKAEEPVKKQTIEEKFDLMFKALNEDEHH